MYHPLLLQWIQSLQHPGPRRGLICVHYKIYSVTCDINYPSHHILLQVPVVIPVLSSLCQAPATSAQVHVKGFVSSHLQICQQHIPQWVCFSLSSFLARAAACVWSRLLPCRPTVVWLIYSSFQAARVVCILCPLACAQTTLYPSQNGKVL